MAPKVVELLAKLTSDPSEFVEGFDKATASAAKFAKDTRQFVGDTATAVQSGATKISAGAGIIGAGIAGALTVVARETDKVDQALAELSTVGVEDFQTIRDAAKDFSDEWSGTTAAAFIESAFDVKSAISSLSDEAVAAFTEAAAIAAKATKAEVGTMTTTFALAFGSMKSLNAEMDNIEWGKGFSSAIAQAVASFRTDGKEMADAISNIGAVATTANIPLGEQLAVLGTLQNSMKSGAEAGTSYRAIVLRLASAGEKLGLDFTDSNGQLKSTVDVVRILQEEFPDLSDAAAQIKLKEAFGDEGFRGITSLIQSVDVLEQGIEDVTTAFENGDEKAVEMADSISNSLGDSTETFRQQISNLADTLGGPVRGMFEPLVEAAGNFVVNLRKFLDDNPQVVSGIVSVAAAVSGFLLVLSGAAAALVVLASIIASLATIGLPALAGIILVLLPFLGLFAGAAAFVLSNFENLKAWFDENKDAIKKTALDAIEPIIEAAKNLGAEIKDRLQGSGQGLLDWITTNIPTIQNLVGKASMFIANTVIPAVGVAIGWIIDKVSWLAEFFVKNWPNAVTIFTAAWDVAKAAIELVGNVLGIAWDVLKSLFGSFTDGSSDNAVAWAEKFAKVLNTVLGVFESILGVANAVVGAVRDIVNFMSDISATALGKLVDLSGLAKSGDPETGSIPKFGAGGIARNPMLAMVGESGPEAIVPLAGGNIPVQISGIGGLAETIAAALGGQNGGNGGASINVFGAPGQDEVTLAERVAAVIMERRG